MKKHFSLRSLTLSLIVLTLLAVIVIITTTSSKAAPTLATKLSGRILLQVEDHGNIWYVSPDNNNQRIELKSPLEIFCFMKTLGLGISNNDLNKYLDNKFPTRLAGKILLAVEQHGEAYYVNPVTLQGHYLGRPQAAFSTMKGLALGISEANLNSVEIMDTTKILEDCNNIIKPNDQEISKIKEKVDNIITNISLVTQEVEPMINFSHIISISTIIDNPNNLVIKEKGLLYDYTFLPDNNLTPTLDKYNKKIISSTESNDNNYNLDITNLTAGSYPFIRAYLITEDNHIIYGNIITVGSIGNSHLPFLPIPSPSISAPIVSIESIKYNLNYFFSGDGSLSGQTSQLVQEGLSGDLVEAIPAPGNDFVVWSDGSKQNPRIDNSVLSDVSVTAIFLPYCSSLTICGEKCAYYGDAYGTTKIGSQCWLDRNLSNTKYNNGINIPYITDDTEWVNFGDFGAYSCYDNNIENCEIYGGLYKWYVVLTGNICPIGWHVPTKSEWDVLAVYPGGDVGVKMKVTSNFSIPWNGTDSLEFAALPSGVRWDNATFHDLGQTTRFWSATPMNSLNRVAWGKILKTDSNFLLGTNNTTEDGWPIRCLKD